MRLSRLIKNTKYLAVVFLLTLLAGPWNALSAQTQNNDVNIYFFWGSGCPHCEEEKPFLEKLKQKYDEVDVYSYEVWFSSKNRDLLKEVGTTLGANVSGVPFTVIGNQTFVGYYNDAITGKEMENRVKYCIENYCPDSLKNILGIAEENPTPPNQSTETETPEIGETKIPDNTEPREKFITVPFMGTIDIYSYSLPALTLILGVLDGFNPCAMWALLFLIGLLLGMKDRRRMWILGSTFIVASAVVYFLFMVAWLQLLLFIGFVAWVRILIGLVALAGGTYSLREFFTTPAGVCKVTGTEKRQKILEKLKLLAHEKSFFLALGGIILLAFAVNLVELVCSAGLPAIYTQVLALNDLTSWQYYLYILLYIFFFMIDDLFVFIVAMTTLRMTGITTKYGHYSHLIGGILMLIIGLLLLFKPELLMFG